MGIYDVVSQTTYLTVTVNFSNVPSNGQSLELIVTGAGMDNITKTYPVIQTSDSFELPPGSARTFSAVSSTPSVTLSAEVQKDLLSIADANVTLNLFPTSSRIIIPDALNYRIVQIDDMNGTSWKTLDYTSFASLGFTDDYQFYPYDIDIDSKGKIYIANNYGGTSLPQIIRIDDFNNPNPKKIVDGISNGITAISIDRTNNYIYYTTAWSQTLYRKKLDLTGTEDLFDIGFETYGMCADQNGYIFLGQAYGAAVKYDPSSSRVVETYTGFLSNPWDVLVKGNYLFVLDKSSSEGNYPITRFLINDPTSYVGYGTFSPGTNQGDFYGPNLFVAILNKKFYITDGDGWSLAKLVSMDDITGSGWKTYGSWSTGQNEFEFFSSC